MEALKGMERIYRTEMGSNALWKFVHTDITGSDVTARLIQRGAKPKDLVAAIDKLIEKRGGEWSEWKELGYILMRERLDLNLWGDTKETMKLYPVWVRSLSEWMQEDAQ
jgi:hypothetical protein